MMKKQQGKRRLQRWLYHGGTLVMELHDNTEYHKDISTWDANIFFAQR
jgi:hypothetical protein